jgi:hypothetical protein
MFSRVFFISVALLLCLSVASCASRSSLPNLTGKSEGYKGLYAETEKKIDTKLAIEKKRPHLKQPAYIRAWRGSYNDGNGNFIEDGWEWILLDKGGPDANF